MVMWSLAVRYVNWKLHFLAATLVYRNLDLMKALNAVKIGSVNHAVVYAFSVWTMPYSHCLPLDNYCWIVDVIVAELGMENNGSHMRNDSKAFVVA